VAKFDFIMFGEFDVGFLIEADYATMRCYSKGITSGALFQHSLNVFERLNPTHSCRQRKQVRIDNIVARHDTLSFRVEAFNAYL